jgi:nicotinic acid phosphoribosyltransferase
MAEIDVLVFLFRMGRTNADVSYNVAWMGLCIIAEISLGIIVACMLSMPKLVEARGDWLATKLSGMSTAFGSIFSGFPLPKFGMRGRSSALSLVSARSELPHVHSTPSQSGSSTVRLQSNAEYDNGSYMLGSEQHSI